MFVTRCVVVRSAVAAAFTTLEWIVVFTFLSNDMYLSLLTKNTGIYQKKFDKMCGATDQLVQVNSSCRLV